ncbi:hypothetical protein LXL04_037357 [Taraxacum kok-saghyz]
MNALLGRTIVGHWRCRFRSTPSVGEVESREQRRWRTFAGDLQLPEEGDEYGFSDQVQPIVDDVRNRGDAAVKDYTSRFDKVELEKIIENLDEAVRESFDVAQKPVEKVVENREGVSISSVGLYVPGGTVVLPSTALMLSIQIDGCKMIVLATPPFSDGSICKEEFKDACMDKTNSIGVNLLASS